MADKSIGKKTVAMLRANLLRRPPAWLPAVTQFPPPNPIIRELSPASVRERGVAHDGMRRRMNDAKRTRTRPPRPGAILFPEDVIRKRFAKEYPVEAIRHPMNLSNEDFTVDTVWSDILADGTDPTRISSENVARRTVFLMEAEGLDQDAAYRKACAEYFSVRAKADIERRVAQQEAEFYGKAPNKPWTQLGIQKEEESLQKSAEFIKAREDMRQAMRTSNRMM